MEIIVNYRPASGVLSIYNEADISLSDSEREEITYGYDGNEDEWNISVRTLGGSFHGMTVLGVRRDEVVGWNTWLSFYLSDRTVEHIMEMIGLWDEDLAEKFGHDDAQRFLVVKRQTVSC